MSRTPAAQEHGQTLWTVRDITALGRSEDEQRALRTVATAVAAGAEPDELFALVAEQVGLLFEAGSSCVVRFDGSQRGALVGSWHMELGPRFAGEVPGGLSLLGPDPLAETSRSGAPVHGHVEVLDPSVGRSTAAALAAPIRANGRLWGALLLVRRGPGPFPDGAEERLDRFGELVAMAIADHETRDTLVVDVMAGLLGTDAGLDATLQAIATTARRVLSADRVTCYLHASLDSKVETLHTTEQDPVRRKVLEQATELTLAQMPLGLHLAGRENPVWTVEDVADSSLVPAGLGQQLHAGAFVGVKLNHPAMERDGKPSLLGSIFITYRVPRSIGAQDRRLARSLGSIASLSIANAALRDATLEMLEDAEERAASDPLTGLANHRSFQERMAEEVERARRHGRALSLAVIDIDHFKGVNDAHGHQVGDEVLSEVAEQIGTVARAEDTLARVGGDEFAWLMPEASGMEAWRAVERARQAIAAYTVPAVGRVTVSAGVCDLREASDAQDLFRLADGALYWAKQHGRDVAFIYSPEVVKVLSDADRAERLAHQQALQSIHVLARAVDAKDPSTRQHSERVADLAAAVAAALEWSPQRIASLHEAGMVHDVGKMAVPDAILFKPGQLTITERQRVQAHAAIGAEIVSDVLEPEQVNWVRSHHEHLNGRGYPDGLSGEAIPDGARILAVADAWDAMTTSRPYHEAMDLADAIIEIRACAGTQFWPPAVHALCELAEREELPLQSVAAP